MPRRNLLKEDPAEVDRQRSEVASCGEPFKFQNLSPPHYVWLRHWRSRPWLCSPGHIMDPITEAVGDDQLMGAFTREGAEMSQVAVHAIFEELPIYLTVLSKHSLLASRVLPMPSPLARDGADRGPAPPTAMDGDPLG